VTVIVLSVRLHEMSKKLESMEAMSVSLQEELLTAKESSGPNGSGKETPPVTEVLVPTKSPTLGPTQQATPTGKETPSVTEGLTPTKSPTSEPTKQPTPTAAREYYIVCVDAGHGGWDGGAVLRTGDGNERDEADDNLWMAKMFRDALEAYDVEVVMTREEDVFLELSERTDIANAAGADALISFHRNSYNGKEEVNGAEIWIHSSRPEEADKLAEAMLDSITAVGGMRDRGVKCGSMSSSKEDYAINRGANMTSMIVELGFISSPADNAAYDENGKAYAEAMAKAVYDWLQAQE
ncbi:MAG: N-acetylmuramoyl-L-alanine amidase, partial [Lachnospiraceae bacterium]